MCPPENLADYISEFRTLLDKHHLQYGMFGHVDAGVLHVRPALDLCDKEQVKLFKQISDEVAELTIKYGGLLWESMEKACVPITAKNSLRQNSGTNFVISKPYSIQTIA